MVALLRNHPVCSSLSNHTPNHTAANSMIVLLANSDDAISSTFAKEISSDSFSELAHYSHGTKSKRSRCQLVC